MRNNILLSNPYVIGAIQTLQFEYGMTFNQVVSDGRWSLDDLLEMGQSLESRKSLYNHKSNGGKSTKRKRVKLGSQFQFLNNKRIISVKDGQIIRRVKKQR